MIACMQGSLEIVQYFITNLDWTTKLNEKNKYGFNGFMEACNSGHFDIVQYFITNLNWTIKLDEKNKDGSNGFMLACRNGHLEIVQHFIRCSKNHPLAEPISNPTKTTKPTRPNVTNPGLSSACWHCCNHGLSP